MGSGRRWRGSWGCRSDEQEMVKPWAQSMTVDRYAAFERATEMKVVKFGDIWWHRVRPFLYRPLLPFKKYDVKVAEGIGRIGVFQYGVEDAQSCNSYLNP